MTEEQIAKRREAGIRDHSIATYIHPLDKEAEAGDSKSKAGVAIKASLTAQSVPGEHIRLLHHTEIRGFIGIYLVDEHLRVIESQETVDGMGKSFNSMKDFHKLHEKFCEHVLDKYID